jgi:hypothetical protein
LVIADTDNVRPYFQQYAQEIEMRMTQDCLVDHSQGAYKFPSLIFRHDRHSSLPTKDGFIPSNHHDQLGSRATLSLGGFQESDMAKVEKIEGSSR